MPYTTRDFLLKSFQRIESDYELPNGDSIRVQELMAIDRIEAIEAAGTDPETGQTLNDNLFWAHVVQRCALDGPGGNPLFTPDDIPLLSGARRPANPNSFYPSVNDIGLFAWTLSEARPDDLKSVGRTTDDVGNTDTNGSDADTRGNDRSVGRGDGASDLGADESDGTGDGDESV